MPSALAILAESAIIATEKATRRRRSASPENTVRTASTTSATPDVAEDDTRVINSPRRSQIDMARFIEPTGPRYQANNGRCQALEPEAPCRSALTRKGRRDAGPS